MHPFTPRSSPCPQLLPGQGGWTLPAEAAAAYLPVFASAHDLSFAEEHLAVQRLLLPVWNRLDSDDAAIKQAYTRSNRWIKRRVVLRRGRTAHGPT